VRGHSGTWAQHAAPLPQTSQNVRRSNNEESASGWELNPPLRFPVKSGPGGVRTRWLPAPGETTKLGHFRESLLVDRERTNGGLGALGKAIKACPPKVDPVAGVHRRGGVPCARGACLENPLDERPLVGMRGSGVGRVSVGGPRLRASPLPAKTFFAWAVDWPFRAWVAAQPAALQFCGILVVSDLSEYWIHRLFHRVPFLWRYHAVHHSCRCMDWLAASRLHLVDVAVTRGLTFVPLFVLGFANGPIFAYLVFVSFHAIFIHANVNFRFGWLSWVIATPRFHHWHHAAQPEAIDKNFAVHLPLIDKVFGTCYLPRTEWPAVYGIEGNPVPESYWQQVIYPVKPEK